MVEYILKLAAISFWGIAIVCGFAGFFKIRRLKASDFRWEIDMLNERDRIRTGTITVFTVLGVLGTLAAATANFIR